MDDNVDAAESLAVVVKASGHDVQAVHDGLSALKVARDYRPNLILLDIGLPGMNGFEVAKKVREELELGKVVLVAMTGYGQESDKERSQQAGFDHHLVKPADFSEVRESWRPSPWRGRDLPGLRGGRRSIPRPTPWRGPRCRRTRGRPAPGLGSAYIG